MKNIRIFLFALLCAVGSSAQSQVFKHYYDLPGASPTVIGTAQTAISTPDGGYLISAFNNVFPSSDPSTVYLIKADQQGNAQWIRDTERAQLWVASESKGGLFVTPEGTYAYATYAPGDSVFLHVFDDQGNRLSKLAFEPPTNIVATGAGFLLIQGRNQHKYHVSVDWQGDIVSEDSTGYDMPPVNIDDVIVTADGALCFLYHYLNASYVGLIKTNMQGAVEWEQQYHVYSTTFSGNKLVQNNQGEFVFLVLHADSSSTCSIIAANSDGDSLWRTDLPLVETQGLTLTSDGGYAIAGNDNTTNGIWLFAKLNALGEILFIKNILKDTMPDLGDGGGINVQEALDGGLLFSGALQYKPVLIKSDALGYYLPKFIAGTVNHDLLPDCIFETDEALLKNRIVSATSQDGTKYYAVSNELGQYFMNVDTGQYTVRIHLPNVLWKVCDDGQYDIDLGVTQQDTAVVDFFAQDSFTCPLMTLALSTNGLRRCFDNDYYLNWCNEGNQPASDVRIDVILPPELTFVSASQPVIQSGDTLRFDVGSVDYNGCGQLTFKVNADCNTTQLGQTLCVEAHITPDTLCYNASGWSGAQVVASAGCVGDTIVEFRLHNIGNAPTQPQLQYIITEDLVVLMQGNFSLNPGGEIVIPRPATGTTQRIEAEQEPGYPFSSLTSAVIESCGTPPFSYNIINQYALDNASPFTDVNCQKVVGSFDPNDKQGFPKGYSVEHFIDPNTEITYLIRFQNTGTDTAFNVTIRDTLATWLDPATIRPSASSHPYTWGLAGAGTLIVHFKDILLPDSDVNEVASHGFIQFSIQQRKNVPLGTVIENTAAIYFDFNAPVITNTTLHTVGKNFYIVSVDEVPGGNLFPVEISPNPFREQTTMRLPDAAPADALFRLYDQTGKLMRSEAFSGRTLQFSAGNMPSGFYWFEIRGTNGQTVGSGKMIRN